MPKTKQCRDCKAEIPKNAKKCMHCGTKQGIGFIGGTFAIFFTLLVVGWVAASVSGSGGNTAHSPEKTPAQKQAARAESDASSLCMQTVRSRAKFPSSVDFSVLHSPANERMAGGGWVISWAFESKNGFGNLIPQMARCGVEHGKLINFSVGNH